MDAWVRAAEARDGAYAARDRALPREADLGRRKKRGGAVGVLVGGKKRGLIRSCHIVTMYYHILNDIK